MRILVTGGAGFIGLTVCRRLLTAGCDVTVLDNFHPQIHNGRCDLPADIASSVRLVRGDVADRQAWVEALAGQNAVIHLAAETGTGQSMYEIERYSRVNLSGTALLLDLISNGHAPALERLVVASSRAIYGEGAYRCGEHGLVYPTSRNAARLQAGQFDPPCPICGKVCTTAPTPESAPFAPTSFYGLTKQTQEQMILLIGATVGIPAVALRYQNVFGPGQSLTNPYTGILAIFSNLARLERPIRIFEDGEESRDFVYIDDVAEATCHAVLDELRGVHSINVGSGERTTVLEVAQQIVKFFGSNSELQITGEFRLGDIRHGSADLTKLRQTLGYTPTRGFADGLKNFLEWAGGSSPESSQYDRSLEELRSRGLMGG
jgi:dTDP-L-rhamnose 4-epimerase